jgi:drug/metabolite transporter (DMT)-like permease
MLSLCMIWGMGQIAIKLGNQGISPIWQAGLRSLGASCLILLWMRLRGVPFKGLPGLTGWRVALGLTFAAEFVFMYIGLGLTTAAHATLLIYSAPFVVALGSHWLLGERLSPARWGGLLLAFLGLALAMSGQPPKGAPQATLLGDLLCLIAGIGWAITTLIVRGTGLKAERPERTLLDQLLISAPVLMGLSVLIGEPGLFAPTPIVWAAFAYQTVLVATFSYLIWFVMVQRYSAASISAFSFMTPIFGVAFAMLLLGESATWTLLIALAMVALGLRLVNRA